MSGVVGAITALGSWRLGLRAASFRGVPFWVNVAGGVGGRRLVDHEYPLRDSGDIEDLGRRTQRYRIQAFVDGDTYMQQRDALLSACQDYATAAVLVHPYLGEITCRAGLLSWQENKADGGCCTFDIEFVKDASQPSPLAGSDTISGLLSGIGSIMNTIAAAYSEVSAIVSDPAYALGALTDGLFGLPAGTIFLLGSDILACAATPSDPATTAAAVQTVFLACAENVVTGQLAPAPSTDPLTGEPLISSPPADLSGGLAALVGWGASLAPAGGFGTAQAAQAAQQAAVVLMVQGCALAATMAVYGQIDFPTSNAAASARAQLLTLLDSQTEAAANAGQDDLYRAWQLVGTLAITDMIQRAQDLPSLAPYTLNASQPSLALAQRFYQDPTRANELAALNDVPHPLFMPAAGVRLSA